MRILRRIALGVAGIATVASLTALSVSGQTHAAGLMDHKMSMAGKTMTRDEKIAMP